METSARTPGPGPDEAPTSPCGHCGAPLRASQDWCLECGSARPGRLRARGAREASRAAAVVVGAVFLLSGSAVAAGYAALQDSDAPAPVAAAPAAAPQPQAAPAPAATTPAPTTTATTTTTAAPELPKAEVAALQLTPTPTPKPAATTTEKKTSTSTTEKTTTTEKKTSPREEPGLQELELGPTAASVYDPYGNAADATDPADSYDDDGQTAFTVTTAAGETSMAVGLTFNLETAREVRAVEIHTSTPGFGVELYGATAGRPADILGGWDHLSDAADVATDPADKGVVTIEFTPGRYRHVLLWFTKPPTAAPSVAITEVRLLD